MLDRAFAEAMGRYGEEAKVIVMPYGGFTVPRGWVVWQQNKWTKHKKCQKQ
ncbi:MAG TPA: hypothetical protein GXX30_11605 [Firmicutes bacterium]|nr:hypothetical protein [Candidatus Fermentithermobacillaceae bacterium]